MNVRERIHQLVDRLPDERADDALGYLERLVGDAGAKSTVRGVFERRPGPAVVSGKEFKVQHKRTWQEFAVEQGRGPLTDVEALGGDFWTEDESIDDFIATVRRWRREGGGG